MSGVCVRKGRDTECDITLEQVVVLPLPCKPTNIITLFFPLVGVQAFTPGSTSWNRKHTSAPAQPRVWGLSVSCYGTTN